MFISTSGRTVSLLCGDVYGTDVCWLWCVLLPVWWLCVYVSCLSALAEWMLSHFVCCRCLIIALFVCLALPVVNYTRASAAEPRLPPSTVCDYCVSAGGTSSCNCKRCVIQNA